MKKDTFETLIKSLSVILTACCFVFDGADAASRTPLRGSASTRRPVATVKSTPNLTTLTPSTTNTETTVAEPVVEEPEPEYEEPEIIENKSSVFSDAINTEIGFGDTTSVSELAEQIRKQREAADARDKENTTKAAQKNALAGGKNACDSGLRKCMQKTCGDDFTKCSLDGDTMFGEKMNKCRRETTCTGEEFRLFTTEIKADRDMNAQMKSYQAVIDCGNKYNACVQEECGSTFGKCLGKAAADRAIKKCTTIAKNCAESDSGLESRMGIVIGHLRESAEKDVKKDEERMYKLRDLMRKQCERFGAMFDERSFDCVYTVNFFAGENQSSPMASRKAYAGSSFICMQEWFGVNVTTFKENAYRETRSQTAASSAMLGAGVGTAVGLITSGAIDRALETQHAKKDLKEECEKQGGTVKDGKCVEGNDDTNKKSETKKEEHEEVVAKDKTKAIQAFQSEIKIGRKIKVDDSLIEDSEVNAAFTGWSTKCRQYKDNNGATSGSVEGVSTKGYHCEIASCNQETHDFQDGKCVKNNKQEKEAEKAACKELDDAIARWDDTNGCTCLPQGTDTYKWNSRQKKCEKQVIKSFVDGIKDKNQQRKATKAEEKKNKQLIAGEVSRIKNSQSKMSNNHSLSITRDEGLLNASEVQTAIENWKQACKDLAQKANIETAEPSENGNKIVCRVTKCASGYSGNDCQPNRNRQPTLGLSTPDLL